jgi:hypothetical protein
MMNFQDALPFLSLFVGLLLLSIVLTPRSLPIRALWICARSRFFNKPNEESVQSELVKTVRSVIKGSEESRQIITITGKDDAEKSCLIRSALSGTPGVIVVSIEPGLSVKAIVTVALKAMVNKIFTLHELEFCSRKVIFWHRLLTFGSSPTLALKLQEGIGKRQFVKVYHAALQLIDAYNLKVVIECSQIDQIDIFGFERVKCIEVLPMTESEIRSIAKFKELFSLVDKDSKLNKITCDILGGFPNSYSLLLSKVRGMEEKSAIGIIKDYLCEKVYQAHQIRKSFQRINSKITKITGTSENKHLPYTLTASQATKIALRYPVDGFQKPSWEELEEKTKK